MILRTLKVYVIVDNICYYIVASKDGRNFSWMYRFDLSTISKSIYVIELPKRDFLLIFITKVV